MNTKEKILTKKTNENDINEKNLENEFKELDK